MPGCTLIPTIVCVCVSSWMNVCACICTCVWSLEVNVESFLQEPTSLFFFSSDTIYLPIVYLLVCLFCVSGGGLMYVTAYTWKQEDNVSEMFFAFNGLNPRN